MTRRSVRSDTPKKGPKRRFSPTFDPPVLRHLSPPEGPHEGPSRLPIRRPADGKFPGAGRLKLWSAGACSRFWWSELDPTERGPVDATTRIPGTGLLPVGASTDSPKRERAPALQR